MHITHWGKLQLLRIFTFLTFPLQILPNWSMASLFTSVDLNVRHFICSDESEGFEFDTNIRQMMQTIRSSSAWSNSSRHCAVNLPVSAVSNERSVWLNLGLFTVRTTGDDECSSEHLLLALDCEAARNTDMNKVNAISATLGAFSCLLMWAESWWTQQSLATCSQEANKLYLQFFIVLNF